MLLRVAVVAGGCILGAASAMTEELGPEQAKAFVVGKLFSYTCFDGTVGVGRVFADGSVIGTIRPGGRGEVRFASLPPGTLRIEGSAMCAHLSGLPMQPCFRVEKIDFRSFRGSIAGLGFAYCDFSQHNARAQIISRGPEPRTRVTSRMLAPAQTAPMQNATVQTAPVVPAQAAPVVPVQPAPAPIVPVQAAPNVPADTTPTATLRPAIAD
ncbi:MAG: hypothetical protein WA858_17965 [Xanthobacteraceae bacterium]